MKPTNHIIVSSAAATSAMTLFSYIVSDQQDENFKEPKLLAGFVKNSLGTIQKTAEPAGWAAHYLIGAGFAAAYYQMLAAFKKKPSAGNGLLYGLAAGVGGILGWEFLFQKHSNPPKTHKTGFYTQLLVAHVVFGVTLSAFKNDRRRARKL